KDHTSSEDQNQKNGDNSQLENAGTQKNSSEMPTNKKIIATNNTNIKEKTQKSFAQIIQRLKEEQKGYDESKIFTAIKKTLNVESLQYSTAMKQQGKEREKLVKAIYEYQKNNLSEKNQQGFDNWDGIISPKGQTVKLLEADVREKLESQNPPSGQ
ncbi:MAG: hypothetical protein F6K62_24265, partial [Sphaerospermopsis sp. SIO1G2]|nr:hypothetical protein [Sphaerospermopsis sp. SIO1G2]